MALSPSAKARKADALHNRLIKAFGSHHFGLVIMTWVEGEDIVLRVIADHAPAVQVRDWLNVELPAKDLFRIAEAAISKGLQAEVDRMLRDAAWLAACEAMKH